MNSRSAAVFLLMLLSFAFQTAQCQERRNVLTLASGAVILSYSGEYDNLWSAFNLTDGNPQSGWSSSKDRTTDNAFEFELAQRYRLQSVVIDTAGAQEQDYPGISARGI